VSAANQSFIPINSSVLIYWTRATHLDYLVSKASPGTAVCPGR
jgi:hypothetical protein